MDFSETFRNELGNEISVTVTPKPIDGASGILVTITGPSSTTDVHITEQEAQVLLRGLETSFRSE